MTHPPLLIAEVERIGRERGWTTRELAERLGVSVKLFYNLRLGHSPLSLATLSRIYVEFGTRRNVRELVGHFLGTEFPASARDVAGSAVPQELPAEIPYMRRWRLAKWAAQVSQGDGPRRGLYVVSSDPARLAAVVRFLQREAARARVGVTVIPAHARLSASHAASAIDSPLLIIERADRMGAAVVAVLDRRRADLPTVVTSIEPRDEIGDVRLRRVLASITANLALDEPRAVLASAPDAAAA